MKKIFSLYLDLWSGIDWIVLPQFYHDDAKRLILFPNQIKAHTLASIYFLHTHTHTAF